MKLLAILLVAAFASIQHVSSAPEKSTPTEKVPAVVPKVPAVDNKAPVVKASTEKVAPAKIVTSEKSILEKFQKEEVVPDVVPVAPKALLKISYPHGLEVNQGNELTPTQVKEQPKVEWNAEPNALYTLVMTDPDAPSREKPIRREWHHWLVGNIPGNDLSKGDVLSEYVGSGPPKDTGLHRYVFLLYKQPGKVQFTEQRINNKTGSKRAQFSAAKFAKKYNLGDPVAGNFYQAKYDDYVPTLHKQLKS